MLHEITSEQLKEWKEFYSLEPWGFDVETEMSATMPTVFANFNRKKGGKSYKTDDFRLKPIGRKKPEVPLTKDEIFDIFKRAARGSDGS